MNPGVILNAYPDSLGGNLAETVRFLSLPALKDAFRSFYILPTLFNTDLDRGFSVISYDLCPSLARREDLAALRGMGLELMVDFILNHLSVLSPQFQDILRRGDDSPYRDFFIDWNRFWEGLGDRTEQGYIQPRPDQFFAGNLRKKTLPILMVRLPDGQEVPYWNTFYQKVFYPRVDLFDLLEAAGGCYDTARRLAERINSELALGRAPGEMDWSGFEACRPAATLLLESRRRYMGQMDVNIQSPLVWQWYDQVMGQLAGYGASTLRLDAYTRLHKAPARANFMNEPETWQILDRLREMARRHGLAVLPEIHAPYAAGAYRKLADQGCMTYDYFLPGLLIDALDTGDTAWLYGWAREQIDGGIRVVNMLGCHDGIPMRDLRGLLPDARIDALAERIEGRGGRRKMIYGDTPEVYQMDVTYYSALGCDDAKLLLARAVQLFMPGIPQVWYVDLLAGENDRAVFDRDPGADNREINRHAYAPEEAAERLTRPVVAEQLRLLALRNTHPAFGPGAAVAAQQPEKHSLRLTWRRGEAWATLDADFRALRYTIHHSEEA